MPLTNPQLTSFCNSQIRQLADAIVAADIKLSPTTAEYNAKDLGTIINAGGAGELIDDGSETDGRTRATGGDVFNFITLLADLKTFLDAPGRRDVLYRWQVNGYRQE